MTGWGIIGLGRIAASFAEAIAGTPGHRVVAVASRDEAKARRFAQAVGPGCAGFGDIERMLGQPGVDVVYIASPNTLHREHALACLAGGRPVLVEKPLAATADDAWAIVEAARAAGLFCMEALWTRFLPAVQEARRLIATGQLGRVTGLAGELAYHHPFAPGSRFHDPNLGGGALLDLGVYPLSLAIHLLGRPDGWSGSGLMAPTGVEQQAAVTLRFKTALATVSCGFAAEGANGMSIVCEGGRIHLMRPMLAPPGLLITHGAPPSPPAAAEPPSLPGAAAGGFTAARKAAVRALNPLGNRPVLKPYRGNGLGHQAEEVARCLGQGLTESPTMPLDESILVLAIIDDVRRQIAREAA
jgi:predicted dehydrogenase